ncbi:MAG: DUF1549 domain-containing protein, partial [Terriglobia bacterium]
MTKKTWVPPTLACLFGISFWGLTPSQAQQPETLQLEDTAQFTATQSECTFFGATRERFLPKTSRFSESVLGRVTRLVSQGSTAGAVASRERPFTSSALGNGNLIDKYIFQDLQANNITPAGKTTDLEFVRRVTLDLTGRIPTPDAVTQFTQSTDPNKRANLVDQLLAKPEWVDKWTMFLGDLYKNTAANVQVTIRPEGRNAFYKYIHDSLAANKPYNQIASEIIGAQGSNSFDQTNGQINYFPLGIVGGGPVQDIFDSQTANIADHFLGLAHVNCLLCHNGSGHLTTLSLWGSRATRTQAWQLSAFLSHTWTRSITTPQDPVNAKARYNY